MCEKLIRVVTNMLRDQLEANAQASGDEGEPSNEPQAEPSRPLYISNRFRLTVTLIKLEHMQSF